MQRDLHLTTPLMSGNDVKVLQTLLKQRGYFAGAFDGEYGPATAQAVYRAKYRLGYLKPDKIAGQTLLTYLSGAKKQNAAMKLLAKRRAAKDKKALKVTVQHGLTPKQMVVQRALTQLGETEHPSGSNKSKYTVWYGLTGPWCAMFVSWVHVSLGFSKKSFRKGQMVAYVPNVVHWAYTGQNGYMLAHAPTDGILVCYDWNRDAVADHIGIAASESTLRKLAPKALDRAIQQFGVLRAGDFWAIEGNTGIGNDSNGGEVMLRKRNRGLVQAFVKVAA